MPFIAHPLLQGGLLQTVGGAFYPHPPLKRPTAQGAHGADVMPPTQVHAVPVGEGDHITVLEDLPVAEQHAETQGLAVLLVHGLGSSAREAGHARRAALFAHRGVRVFRMNHRGVADGRLLARGIYHGARTPDLHAAVCAVAQRLEHNPLANTPQRLVIAADSLSGNMLLALAGQCAAGVLPPLPSCVQLLVAVCPVVDLKASSCLLPKAGFGLIDAHFTRVLKRRIEERHRDFPDLGPTGLPTRFTLPELDECYVAKHGGFSSATHYYETASAAPWLPHISLPTCVLLPADDPINATPPELFQRHPYIKLLRPASGGHMGFIAAHRTPFGSKHWLDWTLYRLATGTYHVES